RHEGEARRRRAGVCKSLPGGQLRGRLPAATMAPHEPARDASMQPDLSISGRARGPRLAVVDVARGVAILAMIVYHAAFDLSANRLIAVDVIASLPWKVFARSIAGTFLLVVGVSLVLATRN